MRAAPVTVKNELMKFGPKQSFVILSNSIRESKQSGVRIGMANTLGLVGNLFM